MNFIDINETNKDEYNMVVTHPLQSYEWGEFRKKTGVRVIRRGVEKNGKIVEGLTLTLHKVPKTKFSIGYLPKGNKPTELLIEELRRIGKQENCIFIQLEPNVENQEARSMNQEEKGEGVTGAGDPHRPPAMKMRTTDGGGDWQDPELEMLNLGFIHSAHPLFTKYNFEIDLNKSEDELLKSFESKTRYNIRLAEKKGVKVIEDNSDTAFKEYLRLTNETTNRQNFYAHTKDYHKKMWETLHQSLVTNHQSLTAHLLTAKFEKEILTTWILFVFKHTLYYPYGASSSKHRNLMASNLIMWEAIRFGKRMGLKKFDLWGALGPDASEKDSWYGFHKFKLGYNPRHVEFVGSYDLVINRPMYEIYKIADKLRWGYLRIRKII